MLVIAMTLVIAGVGMALYLFAQNPKWVEVGRITYFAGVLAFMLNARNLIEVVVR